MARRILNWFVFSNFFIAACAVLMVVQTDQLLLEKPSNPHYLLFVFFASICSYNFHWWLTPHSLVPSPRIQWATQFRDLHFILFLSGLLAAAFFSLHLLPYWKGLLAVALATFLYSAPKIPSPWFRQLRKVALGKTIFLALVWTGVTTLIPAWMSGTPWNGELWLFIISRYFLIYAVCILFDYRDREDDRREGVRSLVTYLSDRNIFILFLVSVLTYVVATFLLLLFDHPLDVVLLLLLPAPLLLGLYRYATRHFSDFFYYVVLDGMMALPAFIGWALNIFTP